MPRPRSCQRELPERVVAEHGREDDLGSRCPQMLGDDAGAADVVVRFSKRTLIVGVLVWPPIIAQCVKLSTMVSPTTCTRFLAIAASVAAGRRMSALALH